MNHLLFESHSPLLVESKAGFASRYKGFGQELYVYLQENDRLFYDKLELFRSSDSTINDSFALYNYDGKSIAIQLDPDCQQIIIWTEDIQIEYGMWEDINYEAIHKFLISIIRR